MEIEIVPTVVPQSSLDISFPRRNHRRKYLQDRTSRNLKSRNRPKRIEPAEERNVNKAPPLTLESFSDTTSPQNRRGKASRKVQKIGSLEKGNVSHVRRNDRKSNNIFISIFTFGLIIGMPVSYAFAPSSERRFKLPTTNTLLKTWEVLAVIMNVVCFGIQSFYNNLNISSNVSRVCYLGHCLSGHLLMWIFLLDRREINKTVKRLIRLTSRLNPAERYEKSRIRTYMVVSFLHVAMNLYVQCMFYFWETWESSTENISAYVPFPRDNGFYQYCSFVFLAGIYSLNMATMFLYYTLFLCVQAYLGSARLFKLFADELQNDIDKKLFRASTANRNILLFKSVSSMASKVDKVFGKFAFIVFADLMLQIFAAVSIYLTDDARLMSLTGAIFGMLFFTSGAVMLCCLFCCGGKVEEEVVSLRKRLIIMSGSLFRQTPDTATLVMFNLLSNDVKSTENCITVWGLFKMSKRCILSTVSSLISYNATLYQLGLMKSQ